MGKGDNRTRKGKIKSGSYGKSRSHAKPVHTPKSKIRLEYAKEEVVAPVIKSAKKAEDDDAATTTEEAPKDASAEVQTKAS